MAFSITHTQYSFEGGMNLVSPGTRLQPNEYLLGINVRSRFGPLEPVMEPIDITEDLPVENKLIQGLYAFGEILVCFVGGEAWYKNAGVSSVGWTQIEDFQLSSSVSRIYAQAVPSSDVLYLRKNKDSSGAGNSPNSGVLLDPTNTGGVSQVALVCQDGVNTPWLIFSDGTSRLAQTFQEWGVSNREYVPIGKQMIHFQGILFVVAPDGRSIYRSVSGRPLDFIVAIDSNGAAVGVDITPTSFAVDSNEIKLIAALNSDNLIIITAYSAYLVTLDFDDTLYGEPTFSEVFLFNAGTINQFCWSDLLGDFAFIDREGLKSFNAVQQLKFEGNNSVFSLGISKVFKGIVQSDAACVGSYDNYTFFAVKTIYSPASIIVYDNVKEKFVSIDMLSSEAIKQFATTYSASQQRFFGCSGAKVFELYSPTSTTPLVATVFSRELDTTNTDSGSTGGIDDIKSETLRIIFEESLEDGEIFVDELVNNTRAGEGYEDEIAAFDSAVYYPVTGPVMPAVIDSIFPIDTNTSRQQGQKLSYVFTWSGGAKLTNFSAKSSSSKSPSSIQQQSRI